jgi:hypothetical protein
MTRPLAVGLHAIRVLAPLVPADRRDEWREEWTAELLSVYAPSAPDRRPREATAGEIVGHVRGAITDAVILRVGGGDQWSLAFRDGVTHFVRRPVGAVAAIAVLALTVGCLLPLALLARALLGSSLLSAERGFRLTLAALAVSCAAALTGSAARAAAALAAVSDCQVPQRRAVETALLAGPALGAGAWIGMLGVGRLLRGVSAPAADAFRDALSAHSATGAPFLAVGLVMVLALYRPRHSSR